MPLHPVRFARWQMGTLFAAGGLVWILRTREDTAYCRARLLRSVAMSDALFFPAGTCLPPHGPLHWAGREGIFALLFLGDCVPSRRRVYVPTGIR